MLGALIPRLAERSPEITDKPRTVPLMTAFLKSAYPILSSISRPSPEMGHYLDPLSKLAVILFANFLTVLI